MSYCPNCGDGYRDEVEICGWCGAQLIPGPMPNAPAPRLEPGMVNLCRLRTNDQIALMTSLLRSAGIPFAATDPGAGELLRIVTGSSTYGQDISVPEAYFQEASELLRAFFRSGPSTMIFEDDEDALAAAQEAPMEEDVPEGQAGNWKALPRFLLAFLVFALLLWLAMGK